MRKFLDVYEKIANKICYYMSFISMFMILFTLGIMTVDVLINLIFNVRILGAYELATSALVLIVFSSWAYTQSQHGHIHVVLFIKMMPQKIRFILFSITSLLSFVVMVIGAYGVFFSFLEKKAKGDSTANLMIPIWPLVLIEFLAFCLMAVVLLKDCLHAIYAIFNKERAEEIEATWV